MISGDVIVARELKIWNCLVIKNRPYESSEINFKDPPEICSDQA